MEEALAQLNVVKSNVLKNKKKQENCFKSIHSVSNLLISCVFISFNLDYDRFYFFVSKKIRKLKNGAQYIDI